MSSLEIVNKFFEEHKSVINDTQNNLTPKIIKASELISKTLKRGKTIFWCGNGGSASDAQHLAAEFVGRFSINRRSLNSISLNTDTSVLTCIANDFGYEKIFSRQLEGLAKSNDLLICLSTSGNSQNIIEAIKFSKKNKLKTLSLLGKNGGKCLNKSDCEIVIPSDNTARIQELHITIGHILCYLVEKKLKFIK
tara:strand:+ start:297 stop:878 length:582 start_codon:yes stop_codon:yes gene_type:complete